MSQLLEQMKPLSLKLGVKAEYFEAYLLQPDEEWLYKLFNNEYKAVSEIRAQLPESAWDNYILFKVKGLAEQEILKETVLELKKAWRKRYAIVHKKATEQGIVAEPVHTKRKKPSK